MYDDAMVTEEEFSRINSTEAAQRLCFPVRAMLKTSGREAEGDREHGSRRRAAN